MNTIRDAIKESIATQNPITIADVVNDVKEIFPDSSELGIKTEASKMLREGNFRKVKDQEKRKTFKWFKPSSVPVQKKDVPTELPDPQTKDDLTMSQVGEAMVKYIDDLKSKIQKLADQVSEEQTNRKKVRDHLQGQIDSQKETIKNLNHKLIAANKRTSHNSKTFSLSEVANFAR